MHKIILNVNLGGLVSNSSRKRNNFLRSTGIAVSALLVASSVIVPTYAAPNNDPVARARAEENRVARSISAIEAELAKVSTKAQENIRHAQVADQNYMKAQDSLDFATEKADKLKEEANKARELVRKAKQEMSYISSTIYRQGSGSVSSVEPYITADGLEDLYIRKVAVEIFGAKADAKLQTVSALQEVANVISKREQKALTEKRKATQDLKDRADVAKDASKDALNQVKASQNKREDLIKELAQKRGVTVQAERERQAAIDQQRRDRENAEARRRAEQQATLPAPAPRPAPAPAPAPAPRPAPAPAPAPRPAPAPAPAPAPNGNVAGAAISFARSKIGLPYIWGGTGPGGYDCSGLVLRAFQYAGVYLPRVAESQYWATRRVPLNQIQPGDLLFWGRPGNIYHVAIYVGGGRMIEAPMPGMSVHEVPVYYSNIMPYAGRV